MAKYRFKLPDVDGISRTVELEALESAPVPPAPSPTPEPEPQPVPPGSGLMYGAWVSASNGQTFGTWATTVARKPLAIARRYEQWELPGSSTLRHLEEGRLVLVSHKPPGGDDAGWRRVASGAEDEMIAALARAYQPYGHRVVFIFHHEPHDNGRSAGEDFKRAFRKVSAAMRSVGVLVGYCGVPSKVTASPDTHYPGDEWIDVECHDPYNWYKYQNRDWETVEERLGEMVALAESRGHPIIWGEINCHPGDAEHSRRQWFADFVAFCREHPIIRGFCLFISPPPTNNWWIKDYRELEPFQDQYVVSVPYDPTTGGTSEGPQVPPAPSEPGSGIPNWVAGERRVDGLPGGWPGGLGENSGFAASIHAGVTWAIRDSGNPAAVYAVWKKDGDWQHREFSVTGAQNKDWEELVYEEARRVLWVVESGQSGGSRYLYEVEEPALGDTEAILLHRYEYAYPDSGSNTESAFWYNGKLHLVKKEDNPAGVYRFDSLREGEVCVPVKVGELADASNISYAKPSHDGRFLLTGSHSTTRIRHFNGLYDGQVIQELNGVGGESACWIPGTYDFLVANESRDVWEVKAT